MNENRTAHGVTDPSKTGPRPKQLVETTVLGIAVGRDKTVVPPDQVYELSTIGCTDGEIARFFGVKEDTLRYNFAEELAKGREFVKIRLRRAMFENACVRMQPAVQIFLAKNILGMTDQVIATESNSPLPWTETDDVEIEELTDEET
tara:strand:+ start:5666 stop:6106 length:441 start_codon:yes stop_codon:yes gene_type:complete